MTAELERYAPHAVEEYRPRFVMDPAEAKALAEQLREVMRSVLVRGTDYGTTPGTSGQSLWQPGAEKLLQLFGFGFANDERDLERDENGSRQGVTYRCVIHK